MPLAKKLQVKDGQTIRLVNAPDGFIIDGVPLVEDAADLVLVFVRNRAELDSIATPALEAVRQDRLAWIAYPKAGQLGTDLNRDIIWELLKAAGVRPVRQVSIDDVWSVLRFRPS